VLFIAEFMHFEWLQGKNPFVFKNATVVEEPLQTATTGLGMEGRPILQTDLKGGLA
jgi:hypothetical protein